VTTKALETYLNDHLAGSRLGVDLANQLAERCEGTPHEASMKRIAAEIDEDRDKLTEIMARVGASENQIKQATAWVGEKASRLKLGDLGGLIGSHDEDYGLFMSIETLKLGVIGKLGLWEALLQQATHHDGLDPVELGTLATRARGQADELERARLQVGARALDADGGAAAA
jgi:hypothetical protein